MYNLQKILEEIDTLLMHCEQVYCFSSEEDLKAMHAQAAKVREVM